MCAALTMAEARAGGQQLELVEARESSRATCRKVVIISILVLTMEKYIDRNSVCSCKNGH